MKLNVICSSTRQDDPHAWPQEALERLRRALLGQPPPEE